MTRQDLGRKVAAARALRGLKQTDVAAMLETSQNRVSLIERGVSTLSAIELKTLSEQLDVPLEFFLGAESYKAPDGGLWAMGIPGQRETGQAA